MNTRQVGLGAAIAGIIMIVGSKLIETAKPEPKGMKASLPFINRLDPAIQDLAKGLLVKAAQDGIELVVVQGLRTNEEQARLYAQGRTAPGAVVTNSPPGSSWHNFGLAFDVAIYNNGKAEWPENEQLWQRIGAIGKSIGLEWGGDFKSIRDRPHFEYHPGMTLSMARAGQRPKVA